MEKEIYIISFDVNKRKKKYTIYEFAKTILQKILWKKIVKEFCEKRLTK